MSCSHKNFRANVDVTRVTGNDETTDPFAFDADVTVCCADCGAAFGWRGVPAGIDPTQPMRSVDALELHAPLLTPSELAMNQPLPGLQEDPPVTRPGFRIEGRGPA